MGSAPSYARSALPHAEGQRVLGHTNVRSLEDERSSTSSISAARLPPLPSPPAIRAQSRIADLPLARRKRQKRVRGYGYGRAAAADEIVRGGASRRRSAGALLRARGDERRSGRGRRQQA